MRDSKALQLFYLDKNNEIEMFIFLRSVPYVSMIDCGAYFGYYSIYFNKLFSKSKVVAFEADIDNFNVLKDSVSSNKSMVKVFNKAVGERRAKEVNFYKPAYIGTTKYPTHGQIGDPAYEDNNLYKSRRYHMRTVEMVPLKDVINEFGKGSTLLKLDIEGYEEKALRSAKKELIERKNLDLIVELMINDINATDIFSFLRDCGYSGYLMTNAGLVSEDRPLVLPKANYNPQEGKLRTVWKNHFFTKRSVKQIKKININAYKYNI